MHTQAQNRQNKEGSFLKEKLGLELSVSNNLNTPITLTKTQFIWIELALSPKNTGALVCPIIRIRASTISSLRLTAQISRPQILAPNN